MFEDLPDLTQKQQNFVMRYVLNGNNAVEAYRFAYDCSGMSDNAIRTEASRLLKNPNVSRWIEYCKKSARQVCEENFKYDVIDAMKEYNELQKKSMLSSRTYSVAKACIDGKCRINGLGEIKKDTVNVVVKMDNIVKDGVEVRFKTGDYQDD